MKRGTRKIAVFAAVLLCCMMVLASLQSVQADTQGGRIKLYASMDAFAGFDVKRERIDGQSYRIHGLVREKTEYPEAEFDIIAAEDIYEEWQLSENLFDAPQRLYLAGETVEILRSDREGLCLSKTLPAGKYLVQQTSEKEGYLKADPVPVEVFSGTEELFFHSEADNLVYTGSRNADEEDADVRSLQLKGPKTLEENAVYGVFAAESMRVDSSVALSQDDEENRNREVVKGTLLGVAKAEEGKAEFSTVMPEGNYRIRKMQTKAITRKALTNSVADEESKDTNASEATEETTEKKEVKKYVLRKTDINGIALEGAEFGMYAVGDNEKVLKKAVSDKKGMVSFENLQEGEYVIRELKAPKGYERSNEIKKIRVAEDWKNQAEHEIRNYVNRTTEDENTVTKKTKESAEKQENASDASNAKPVKTGDMRIPLWKWMLAVSLTLVVIAGLISVCRRRRHFR